MSDARRAEILIVGAGPAGLALAIGLARLGRYQVTVVDRRQSIGNTLGEVLPPGIVGPLSQLGVWDAFLDDGHLPSSGVSIWWGNSQRRDWDYIRSPFGRGWHIDRCRFVLRLLNTARSLGAKVCLGARVTGYQRMDDDSWNIDVLRHDRGRERWNVQLIVDAAGRSTVFSRLTGPRLSLDSLVALAKYVRLPPGRPWEPRLWLEAVQDGWWYSAPLPDGRAVAVYLTDADCLADDPAASLARALRMAPFTAERLDGGVVDGGLRICRANISRVTSFISPGFLALGDAAFTTDPLRGRGIYSALDQAIRWVEPISAALAGSDAAIVSMNNELETEFSTFLQGLPAHYGLETRWSASTFWDRRQSRWSARFCLTNAGCENIWR
jgi:flavin-dependent dehydrogenase